MVPEKGALTETSILSYMITNRSHDQRMSTSDDEARAKLTVSILAISASCST